MEIIFSNQRWRRLALAIIVLLVLSGLTFSGIAALKNRSKPAASCPEIFPISIQGKGYVAINESHNGNIINLQTGEHLAVDLIYFPATGNSWSMTQNTDPAVLREVKSVYNLDDVWNTVGGEFSTYVTWIFQANQSGMTRLTLDYGKIENEVSSIDHSFSVTVNVK